ncbi:hypothetical protein [Enterovibrio coralii]|uniref:hypothetical protein n=1 Tax=Enterovibrio coralii TaxID=294935 RepID=UPI000B2945C7|nr:hypothetical protein [Enterovibrio coralii]
MIKNNKKIKHLFAVSALAFAVAQPVMAHEYVVTPEMAESYGLTMPTLTADMVKIPYSYLVYGGQVEFTLNGAELSTTDINVLRNAISVSSDNRLVPYRATPTSVRLRVSGDFDLRALNFVDFTIDSSVLTVPQDLSISMPVEHDMPAPDTPHEDANKVAELNGVSVNATDFLSGSGKVFTINLKEGQFLPGCTDPIAHSIIKTSNVQGIVRIWRRTSNSVDFIVEGGYHTTSSGNWNFELSPETTTLARHFT